MGLLDKLLRRRSKLETCTITRDKLDDHICETLEDDSPRFAKAMNAPVIDGEEVAHFDDLMRDVFKSFYTYDEPNVLDREDVREDHHLNQRVMSRLIGSEEHQRTRTETKHSRLQAAMAALEVGDRVRELYKTELHDLAEEQTRAAESQQALDDALSAGDEEGAENAQRALEESGERMDGMGISPDAVASLTDAVDDARESARALRWVPGVGPGTEARIPADDAIKLAERFNTPEMRDLAGMIGRLVPDMRSKRLQRTKQGREEIVDIELGDDITRVLPSELMELAEPSMEMNFMRRYYERGLLQYEQEGMVEVRAGHMTICVDSSLSMQGAKHKWARGVCGAIIAICSREKRDVAVLDYASAGQLRSWEFKSGRAFDVEAFTEMLEHFFGGGTDATPALREAKRIIDTAPGYDRADVVLITDGEDRWEDEDVALREEFTRDNVSVYGVMIGARPTEYLTEMCDTAIPAYDLSGNNEATDALAKHV